ncbi:hypothetical protein BpHYR1_041530 [Brachionus plicatilis]|uniref:Uncharacterized protein n=1 Tax=Brachionus plicatilis TaxID=10195 RepID=A0A3M7Q296_BRAPC|nr:hypothetical protein BpHYR1_041530 [Brachionus plicatilis]
MPVGLGCVCGQGDSYLALVSIRVQIGETFMGQLHHLLNLVTVDLNKSTLVNRKIRLRLFEKFDCRIIFHFPFPFLIKSIIKACI